MILPNVLALVAGGLLSILLCELIKRVGRLKRFGIWYTVLFMPLVLFTPAIIYLYLFPYSGVMNGMTYFPALLATAVGLLFYLGTFSVAFIISVNDRRRFIYCLIAFYAASATFLIYLNSDSLRPVIA
jgi:hypothetical protein